MPSLASAHRSRGSLVLTAAVLLGSGIAGCGSSPAASVDTSEPPAAGRAATQSAESIRLREDALASARVWHPPAVPISAANLRDNPVEDAAFSPDRELSCRFVLEEVGGTTQKFYCERAGGERIKIKYGAGNPELHAEVAASRLLTALGFAADRMFVVRAVACAGCPTFPFQALRCFRRTGARSLCFPGGLDPARIVRFDVAVVERRLAGRVIQATEDQGWAWYELDRIDPARGGSTRAEVDALRLVAVFLAHWDNKAGNQRLICPPGADRPDGSCAGPLAIVQDLGATFGPLKLDLHHWRLGRVWKDPRTCAVSMQHLPWGGATFPDATISEGGRRLLLDLLEQLSDAQLRDLFEGSRVTLHDQVSAEGRSADAWVRVFKDRVDQIRAAGPCE